MLLLALILFPLPPPRSPTSCGVGARGWCSAWAPPFSSRAGDGESLATPGARPDAGRMARPTMLGLVVLTLVSILFSAPLWFRTPSGPSARDAARRPAFACACSGFFTATLARREPAFRADLGRHGNDDARRSRRSSFTVTIADRSRRCGSTWSSRRSASRSRCWRLPCWRRRSRVGGRAALMLDLILVLHAATLDRAWLRAAYVFALAGFGTKMGLAPPIPGSRTRMVRRRASWRRLMSGAIDDLRVSRPGALRAAIVFAAGLTDFARPLLIALGSCLTSSSAAFMIGQSDIKRLLAYSSVEHMGLPLVSDSASAAPGRLARCFTSSTTAWRRA